MLRSPPSSCPAWPAESAAPPICPHDRPTTSRSAGAATRRMASSARALPSADATDGEGRVRLNGSFAFVPDAPGADVLVGVALHDGRPIGVAILGDAPGVKVEAVSRYDSTRSLGHVTLKRRSRRRAGRSRGLARGRLASRAGPDRRRVDRQRRDRAGRVGRVRQGAVHVRPRDRLLSGDQALPDRGPAPARERTLAAVLRRLGTHGRAARSFRWPPTPPARSPRARSTRPHAR